MDNKQIETVIKNICPSYFRACVPISDLIYMNKLIVPDSKNIFILNTTAKQNIIGHWILLFISSSDITFFDSFGRIPDEIDVRINQFINKVHPEKLIVNRKRLQSRYSCACGAYSIFYSVFLCKGYSLEEINGWFSKNTSLNDRSVVNWLKQRLPSISTANILHCKNGNN